jgi:putative nucleotidyltransferase with HDIG domain
MGDTATASTTRYLPQVLIATLVVLAAPAVVVWGLASSGSVTAFVPLLFVGLGVSLIINFIGRTVWEATPGGDDLLFSDLMLWGWIRRVRTERRLSGARALLLDDGTGLKPGVKIDVLKDLASSLESRDPYTHGHSRRVARYATMIAKKMDLSADEVQKVRTAAAVHDVGKLEIPLSVLNKPGRLTDEEFDVIKTHAPLGAEMVSDLGDRELTEMVAHHHERLDGSGYPSRLAGTDIPLGARIIAVADTFDALTSTRAYRPAKRHKDALGILHSEAGTQLDPLVVSAFDRCYAGSFGGITAWALLAGLPHRLWAPLESQLHAAGGTAMSKAMTIMARAASTPTCTRTPAGTTTAATPTATRTPSTVTASTTRC